MVAHASEEEETNDGIQQGLPPPKKDQASVVNNVARSISPPLQKEQSTGNQ